MGWMENESGGSRLAEVLVFLFFFVKAIPSFSPLSFPFLVSVLNTSHYHTLLSCPLGCLAAEFYFFFIFTSLLLPLPRFSSVPCWLVSPCGQWVFLLGIYSTLVICAICAICAYCV